MLLILPVFALAFWRSPPHEPAAFARSTAADSDPAARQAPQYRPFLVSDSVEEHVHSASVTALNNGDLMSAWYSGSREGARDVNIRAARFDADSGKWGDEYNLMSRSSTETALQRNIRKLGNPVVAQAPDGRLWLFYVSVSMGGWAGSAINAMHSDDLGRSWSSPKRLTTSPFLNLSTLVRNQPVFHEDGSIGLPIYHEFMGKFPEYLYLSPDGEVMDKYRIGKGDRSLQPSVVPLGNERAVALLRNAGHESDRVLASYSENRGETWSQPAPVSPRNPNSAVAAVTEGYGDRDVLTALNDLRDGRYRLSLYHSREGLSDWRRVNVVDVSLSEQETLDADAFRRAMRERIENIEPATGEFAGQKEEILDHASARACDGNERCEVKFEYPSLIRAADGQYHLVYSWNNTFIKHVTFNQAWLETHL